jgi:pre-mRNA-splicing factor RBM22/SLT11
VVCEDCLGPNPYIRMQRQDYAAECAISGRPFTVFRWRPGTEARYKKTVVCKEIALAKNVCQVCLLDLDYGIPVQARDAALGREAANNETALMGAKSDVNIEYQTEQIARRIANGEDVAAEASGLAAGGALVAGGAGGKARAHEILSRMARKKPYYNKNKTAICTFWLRNACTRADCPYRPCNGDTHMPELTSAPEMRTQNIKDRYYGVNDPVAEKMLKRDEERDAAAKKAMAPPEDATITTLYVGGIDERVTEETLRDHFYAFGKLKSVRVMHAKKCAFVTFDDRAGAEAAAAAGHEARVAGLRCRVMWGKPSAAKRKNLPAGNAPGGPQQAPAGSAQKAHQQVSNPGAFDPASMPLPFAPPAGKDARAAYPSTDPRALGSRGAEKE